MTAINWSEIYLDSNLPCREFADVSQSLNGGSFAIHARLFPSEFTDHESASLSVELNEDAAWWKKRNELDGFLLSAEDLAEQKSLENTILYCELMKSIVRLLRSRNVKFSVVGDFEFDN